VTTSGEIPLLFIQEKGQGISNSLSLQKMSIICYIGQHRVQKVFQIPYS